MIRIDANPTVLNPRDWARRSAVESDFERLITDDCTVSVNGEPVIVYLKLAADQWASPKLDQIEQAVRHIRYMTNARVSGLATTSRIFGYFPRIAIRNDYCAATGLSSESPAEHSVIAAGAEVGARYYAEVAPDLFARHQELTRTRVLPDYRLSGDAYTSGIVNQNNPLKYHTDSGNYEDTWSAMLGFKRDIGGGYLSVPAFGLGFEIADRSLFLFDGAKWLHGVTPIRMLSGRALRHTIVYYSLKAMWKCLEPAAELARIQRKRTVRERSQAEHGR